MILTLIGLPESNSGRSIEPRKNAATEIEMLSTLAIQIRNRHSNQHAMDLLTRIIAILLFVSAISSFGCGTKPAVNGNSATNVNSNSNSAANATNDNVEDLRSLIQIPFEPEEVVFRVLNTADKKQRLLAVFVLTPEIHRSLEGRLTSAGAGHQQLVTVEQWFPAELTSMAEMSGETTISGTAFPATEFFQPPYTDGNIVFIPQTDYAVLDLQAK